MRKAMKENTSELKFRINEQSVSFVALKIFLDVLKYPIYFSLYLDPPTKFQAEEWRQPLSPAQKKIQLEEFVLFATGVETFSHSRRLGTNLNGT